MDIRFLGVSRDSSTILMDFLFEMGIAPPYIFYNNLEIDIQPLQYNSPNEILISTENPVNRDYKVFFGAAGPQNKAKIFISFQQSAGVRENEFATLIHKTAYIAPSSQINHGVLIEPLSVISSQSKIGFGVFIKRGSLIGHHNIIGDFTDINPGVVISGKVQIGEHCIIGSGTVIRDNISIGKNTTIGVGSVVTKDMPDNCIAYGNPCKVWKMKED